MLPNSKKTPRKRRQPSKTAADSALPASRPQYHDYWSLRLFGPNAEDQIDIALSHLIQGATTISDHETVVYLASRKAALECAATALGLGLTCAEPEPVANQNWHERCAELWAPLTIGALTIQPVPSTKDLPASPRVDRSLLLIPGTGFGTGHHATTRMIIELMQRPTIGRKPPRRCLDLGTGSGILALAAATLFPCAVDAIDNDPMAIENAVENASMNALQGEVRWTVGTIQVAAPPYDLVCANLYAVLLEELADPIRATLADSAFLLLSGIRREECAKIRSIFDQKRLVLRESLEADGWCGLMYETFV